MRENSVVLVKGISATGKGTRVSTLLEYLKSKYQYNTIFLTERIGNEVLKSPKQVGVYFPFINTFFFGSWIRSNKGARLISWGSLDAFSSYKNPLYKDVLKLCRGCNIIWEGYFGGETLDVQFKSLLEAGFIDNRYIHYYYDEDEGYFERCKTRSGEEGRGQCLKKNKMLKDEFKREAILKKKRKQFDDIVGEGEFIYTFHKYNEPVEVFGINVLDWLELYDDIRPFKNNIQQFDTRRSVENPDSNYQKFLSNFENGDGFNEYLLAYGENGEFLGKKLRLLYPG